jgi:hypothetical protein
MDIFNKQTFKITLLNYSMKLWNTMFIIISLYLTIPGVEQMVELIRAGSNNINVYALINIWIVIAASFAGLLRLIVVKEDQFPNFIMCFLIMLFILPVTALGFFGYEVQYLLFLFIFLLIFMLLKLVRSIGKT